MGTWDVGIVDPNLGLNYCSHGFMLTGLCQVASMFSLQNGYHALLSGFMAWMRKDHSGLAQDTVSVSPRFLDGLDLSFVLSSLLSPDTPNLQNEGSRLLLKLQGQEGRTQPSWPWLPLLSWLLLVSRCRLVIRVKVCEQAGAGARQPPSLGILSCWHLGTHVPNGTRVQHQFLLLNFLMPTKEYLSLA